MAMRTHIDWLTFTLIPRYDLQRQAEMSVDESYAAAIEQAFLMTFGAELTGKVFGGTWEKRERSRAPYTDAWTMANGNITLFASVNLTHCCVEISGNGCEALLTAGLMSSVLEKIAERVTRIDIASDLETQTTPTQFVSKTKHKRMQASGFQKSNSGETCYVGSQKSDRYARVYRYNDPHPRAHLLRIEHVFRRDYAKIVASECIASGVDEVSNAAGNAFGWSHSDWDTTDGDLVDLSVVKPERNGGKTVYWLVHSVAPAFQKLCENGTIKNREAFLREYFGAE